MAMRNGVDRNSQALLTQFVSGAWWAMIVAIVFTGINIVLLLTGSDQAYLFSLTVPYWLVGFGTAMDLPGQTTYTMTGLTLGLGLLAVYLLLWLPLKKAPGCILAELVLTILDTLALVGLTVWMAEPTLPVMDFAFHVLLIVQLFRGCQAAFKLRKQREESPISPYAGADAFPQAQNTTAGAEEPWQYQDAAPDTAEPQTRGTSPDLDEPWQERGGPEL